MLGAQAHRGLAVWIGVNRLEEGLGLLVLVARGGNFALRKGDVEAVEVIVSCAHHGGELGDVTTRLVQVSHCNGEMSKIFEGVNNVFLAVDRPCQIEHLSIKLRCAHPVA